MEHVRFASGVLTCWALTVLAASAAAVSPFRIDAVTPFVTMVHDDNGIWGGISMGTTHQERPAYQAKKRLSTAGIPAATWRQIREARIRILFFIQDVSYLARTPNGLDESFELVVNGHVHRYATAAGFPAKYRSRDKFNWQWTDFVVPVSELNHGDNEIIVRKAPAAGNKNDDYIYVGIDNSVRNGNSFMSEDGGVTWTH